MATGSKEIELKVGRRTQDGTISLSAHIPQILTLRVMYGAERASSVMLTLQQIRELRSALGEMETLITAGSEQPRTVRWDGGERRRTAA